MVPARRRRPPHARAPPRQRRQLRQLPPHRPPAAATARQPPARSRPITRGRPSCEDGGWLQKEAAESTVVDEDEVDGMNGPPSCPSLLRLWTAAREKGKSKASAFDQALECEREGLVGFERD